MNKTISLSREQIMEMAKCLASAEYFIETFCWLQKQASAGIVENTSIAPFVMGKEEGEPHFFQRRILRWLMKKENVLTIKSRRVGCSWIAAAYAAWLINFHENINCVFISRTGKDAQKILDKVKFILKNLALHDAEDIRKATSAGWLRGEIVAENSERIAIGFRDDKGVVTTQSVVESITTTDDAARGGDVTFCVFDELAFYEHPDETWSSATKALALGGHWMAVSTPGSIGDVFHRLCARGDLAELGRLDEPLDYEYIKIHWKDAGITERQVERSSVGDSEEKRAQEWEWNFLATGSLAFNPTHLAACYKPPEEYPEIAQALANYREAVKYSGGEFIYYSGVDTASGRQKTTTRNRKSHERDYHSFVTLTKDRIQAFAYHSREPINQWAGTVADDGLGRIELEGRVSRMHSEWPGLCWIEEEGPGYITYHAHRLPQDTISQVTPVKMSALMKRSIITRLKLLIEAHEIVITDPFTYQCLTVYQQTNPDQYEAPSGYYDDPVMALAIASAALDSHGALAFTFGRLDRVSRHGGAMEVDILERYNSGPLVQIDVPAANKSVVEFLPKLPALDTDYARLREMQRYDDKLYDLLSKEV